MLEGDLFSKAVEQAKFYYHCEDISNEFSNFLSENDFSYSEENFDIRFIVNEHSISAEIEDSKILINQQGMQSQIDDLKQIIYLNRNIAVENSIIETYHKVRKVSSDNNPLTSELFWRSLKLILDTSIDERDSIIGLKKSVKSILKMSDSESDLNIDIYSCDEIIKKQLSWNDTLEYRGLYLTFKGSSDYYRDVLVAIHEAILIFENKSELLALNKQSETSQGIVKILLNELQVPIIVINNDGLVIHHNTSFSQLNILPRAVSEKVGGWIEGTKGEKFRVQESSVTQSQKIYFLIKQNEQPSSQSIEKQSELGIMAGSIAHELNNPVAGILAAITLLELDDWEDESINVIREMKESTLRCKGLIETFLGFSKYRGMKTFYANLGDVLERTISLLRYRMVESGISIQIDNGGLCDNNVKAAVLPMVLYTVFNDLMTLLSHKILIESNLSKTLNIVLIRSQQSLIIECQNFIFTDKDISQFENMLTLHLLEMESMSLTVANNQIIIKGIFDV